MVGVSEREFRKEIADRLTRARKRKGWSLRELSKRCGVRRQEVGAYLAGTRRITVRALFQIADALGCDVEIDLIGRGV